MLIYHPAYDAYHCVFRSLVITGHLKSIEIDKLRLLDFFFVFPAELRKVSLPNNIIGIKKLAASLVNEYRGPVNMVFTFKDMEQIQYAAYRSLVASGIFDGENFNSGVVSRTDIELPEYLIEAVGESIFRDGEIISVLIDKIDKIPLQGLEGLKRRTGLMEYRYDVA